jgi:hypothetical protein
MCVEFGDSRGHPAQAFFERAVFAAAELTRIAETFKLQDVGGAVGVYERCGDLPVIGKGVEELLRSHEVQRAANAVIAVATHPADASALQEKAGRDNSVDN